MHKFIVICAILVLLPPHAARSSPQPDKPLSVCEQYNKARVVLLGRVVGRDSVWVTDFSKNLTPPPLRIEAVRVAVLESFSGTAKRDVLVSAPFRGFGAISGFNHPVPRFDPPLEVGAAYVFYAGESFTEPLSYMAGEVIPADRAPLEELRRLSRMTTGSIRGGLGGFTLSRPESSTFLGRVLERGYRLAPFPSGGTISVYPPVKVEVVHVQVLESFSAMPAQDLWVAAPDGPLDHPLLFRFNPELEIGETYLFSAVDQRWSVVRPEDFSGLLARTVIPSRFVPLEQLRRLRRSESDGTAEQKMTVTARNEQSRFEATVTASPRMEYSFENVPPGTYSFEVERNGVHYSGPWFAEVRAGGCATANLLNKGLLPVPFSDCSWAAQHPSWCDKFRAAGAVFAARIERQFNPGPEPLVFHDKHGDWSAGDRVKADVRGAAIAPLEVLRGNKGTKESLQFKRYYEFPACGVYPKSGESYIFFANYYGYLFHPLLIVKNDSDVLDELKRCSSEK